MAQKVERDYSYFGIINIKETGLYPTSSMTDFKGKPCPLISVGVVLLNSQLGFKNLSFS